jgi:uroporphyrinogen-III synthase
VHIVITRPKEDSFNLINNLIKLGHSVTHLPVIKIEKLETKKINLQNYKALIFTSAKAIKYMNVEKFNSKIKCFCVGNATEHTAKQAGFINTFSSGVTLDALIELINRVLDNKSEKILYLSSEFISKDLDIDLIKAGYSVDRVSNYTSLQV